MARLPTPGSDSGAWGDILNNYLSVEHNSDGSLKDVVRNSDGRLTNSRIPSDNSVSTTKIQDGAVTDIKLATTFIPASQKGAANGIASLTGTTLTSSQLPANVATKSASSSDTGKAIDAYTGQPLVISSASSGGELAFAERQDAITLTGSSSYQSVPSVVTAFTLTTTTRVEVEAYVPLMILNSTGANARGKLAVFINGTKRAFAQVGNSTVAAPHNNITARRILTLPAGDYIISLQVHCLGSITLYGSEDASGDDSGAMYVRAVKV